MRIARKLFALTVMALAAMALSATSASAVEVSDEASTAHCDPVELHAHDDVEGGCLVRAESEEETRVQVFVGPPVNDFVTISTCEDQFEAAIGEDGTGYLYEAITTEHEDGDPCTRTQCDEADDAEVPHARVPWPLTLTSTNSMEIEFCLRELGTPEGTPGVPCHTNIDINANPNHNYEFRANGTTSGLCDNLGGFVRVIGHWHTVTDEVHPAIEIAAP